MAKLSAIGGGTPGRGPRWATKTPAVPPRPATGPTPPQKPNPPESTRKRALDPRRDKAVDHQDTNRQERDTQRVFGYADGQRTAGMNRAAGVSSRYLRAVRIRGHGGSGRFSRILPDMADVSCEMLSHDHQGTRPGRDLGPWSRSRLRQQVSQEMPCVRGPVEISFPPDSLPMPSPA